MKQVSMYKLLTILCIENKQQLTAWADTSLHLPSVHKLNQPIRDFGRNTSSNGHKNTKSYKHFLLSSSAVLKSLAISVAPFEPMCFKYCFRQRLEACSRYLLGTEFDRDVSFGQSTRSELPRRGQILFIASSASKTYRTTSISRIIISGINLCQNRFISQSHQSLKSQTTCEYQINLIHNHPG